MIPNYTINAEDLSRKKFVVNLLTMWTGPKWTGRGTYVRFVRPKKVRHLSDLLGKRGKKMKTMMINLVGNLGLEPNVNYMTALAQIAHKGCGFKG